MADRGTTQRFAAHHAKKWAREDLNLYSFRNQNLNLARLPVPPLAQRREASFMRRISKVPRFTLHVSRFKPQKQALHSKYCYRKTNAVRKMDCAQGLHQNLRLPDE